MMSREVGYESHTSNQLLSSLPESVLRDLQSEVRHVAMSRNALLYDVSDPIEHLYFPESGLLSLRIKMRDGASVPVFMVGNEGMVGVPAILGSTRSFVRVSVAESGTCVQIPARALPRLAQHESVRRMLQRYTIAFFGCVAQHCACCRVHDVLQRCAVQLLMASDRVRGAEFVLTQEFLGNMLGLRRVNVGMAAQQLQRMGCIEYVRGRITVRDRARLEEAACECYLAVKRQLSVAAE